MNKFFASLFSLQYLNVRENPAIRRKRAEGEAGFSRRQPDEQGVDSFSTSEQ